VKKDVEHGTGICFKCGSTEHAVYKCYLKLKPGKLSDSRWLIGTM